jgi:hypothetical protein
MMTQVIFFKIFKFFNFLKDNGDTYCIYTMYDSDKTEKKLIKKKDILKLEEDLIYLDYPVDNLDYCIISQSY